MFPEALYEELLELDRNNMATQFLASGGEFDGTIRRHSLHQEWSDGAEFFLHRREDMLAGYLEVMPRLPWQADGALIADQPQLLRGRHASRALGRSLVCP